MRKEWKHKNNCTPQLYTNTKNVQDQRIMFAEKRLVNFMSVVNEIFYFLIANSSNFVRFCSIITTENVKALLDGVTTTPSHTLISVAIPKIKSYYLFNDRVDYD
jgi:hypothetical protein